MDASLNTKTVTVNGFVFTHNKTNGTVGIKVESGSTEVNVNGKISTENGLRLEFEDIAGYGVDAWVEIRNEAKEETLPSYTDILKMDENGFTALASEMTTSVMSLVDKLPDVLGEELANMILENLDFSDLFPNTAKESEYYTSGQYTFFENESNPDGITADILKELYDKTVSIITEGSADEGDKGFSEYLQCYVAVFYRQEGNRIFHIEKGYEDDSYSQIVGYYCIISDTNGRGIEIYLDNLKLAEGFTVFLYDGTTDSPNGVLYYDKDGSFSGEYFGDVEPEE